MTIHSPLGKEHAEFLLNAMQQEAMRRYKERNTPSPSGDAHEQEGRGR